MRRQRNMAQMKEQIKTPEKELNKMEISNLSDAEFKTLVIKMLEELIGYCNSIKKTRAEMKGALSEIKKTLQGTNSGMNETENQINDLECKGEKNIQSEQQEEKRIQTNKDRLRSFWDNFKYTNIEIIGMPEGEEKEQEIENLFLKNEGNFPILVKEIDFQEGQEAQSPKEVQPMEAHTKAHHNYIIQDQR